jgi:hypothetical protein
VWTTAEQPTVARAVLSITKKGNISNSRALRIITKKEKVALLNADPRQKVVEQA